MSPVGRTVEKLSPSCYGPEEAFLALGEHTHLALYMAAVTALRARLRSPRREPSAATDRFCIRHRPSVFAAGMRLHPPEADLPEGDPDRPSRVEAV